jgi:hypothetical protein
LIAIGDAGDYSHKGEENQTALAEFAGHDDRSARRLTRGSQAKILQPSA